jgi:hypothetical protein
LAPVANGGLLLQSPLGRLSRTALALAVRLRLDAAGMNEFWKKVEDEAPPHDQRLLLFTQPSSPYDAAQAHVYDVVVGYWYGNKGFVPANSPASKETGQILHVPRWAYLPETGVRLRPLDGLNNKR